MELIRAYSTIDIKAMNEDNGKRTFSGIASTPSTDRMGDIVEPKGMEIKLPTPLLWIRQAPTGGTLRVQAVRARTGLGCSQPFDVKVTPA